MIPVRIESRQRDAALERKWGSPVLPVAIDHPVDTERSFAKLPFELQSAAIELAPGPVLPAIGSRESGEGPRSGSIVKMVLDSRRGVAVPKRSSTESQVAGARLGPARE